MKATDINSDLTAERLKQLTHYDPVTGVFTPIEFRMGVRNKGLGNTEKNGYVRICINYRRYQASRLAWLYMTGKWPVQMIDHIDGDRANNRFANLREADAHQNGANRKKPRNYGASGFKGVSRKPGHWQASIRVHGRLLFLGKFESAEKAHAAYIAAANQHFGEFVRSA